MLVICREAMVERYLRSYPSPVAFQVNGPVDQRFMVTDWSSRFDGGCGRGSDSSVEVGLEALDETTARRRTIDDTSGLLCHQYFAAEERRGSVCVRTKNHLDGWPSARCCRGRTPGIDEDVVVPTFLLHHFHMLVAYCSSRRIHICHFGEDTVSPLASALNGFNSPSHSLHHSLRVPRAHQAN